MTPHRATRNRLALAAWVGLGATVACADEPPPTLSIAPQAVESRAPAASPRVRQPGRSVPRAEAGGWWVGTAGVALALAAFGGVSLAARRWMPGAGESASMRVLGRVHLSSKHSACLLRVGGRTLLVGLGPGGPPTLLDEIVDPDPDPLPHPPRPAPANRPVSVVVAPRIGGAS